MRSSLSYSVAVLLSLLLHAAVVAAFLVDWQPETERIIMQPQYIEAKLVALTPKAKAEPAKPKSKPAKPKVDLAAQRRKEERRKAEIAARKKAAEKKRLEQEKLAAAERERKEKAAAGRVASPTGG